ncbi:MAG: M16 family metallopeptidase [Verrucomicrobiales bacterium]
MSEVQLTELPFEKFLLPNGLTVILRQDRSVPLVSLQAWVETGSIHEESFLGAGLSHFVEHMLFKGTERRHSDDIAREVSSMGGQINAYTSFDRTVYYIDGPAEGAIGCLDVLMDVVCNATLPEDEFTSEQEVIRREFSMGKDDPEKVASHEMFATCFQVHPYGVPSHGAS